MFSRKTLFFATALSLLATGAKADTPACVSVDCAALGYTQTASQCSGADTILKCPFDTSLVACPTTVSTPILSIAQKFLLSLCHTEPLYTLGTSISSCAVAHFGTGPFCSYISYDGSPYISEIKSLKIEKNTCTNYFSDNPSAYSSMKTTQDFVSLLENILLYDPCAHEVTVNEYETCTQYCASDNTKCIAKRSMTCDEAITIAAAGTKLTAQSASSGALDDPLYFLTENVLISYLDSLDQEFREASSLPPCANDSSVLQHPKLVIQLVGYLTGGSFGVDTTILQVGNGMTGTTSIDISNNFLAENLPVFAYNSSAVLSFNISADNSDRDIKVVTGINCTNPTGQTAGCSLRYSSYNYKLQNNTKVTYCSYGSAKIEPTCTGNNITCTQGSDYSCLAPEE